MSADERFHVDIRRGTGRMILELRGELDMASSGLLEEVLAEADLGDSDAVVLDLSGVSFTDSTGLKAIFKVRKAVRDGGRSFAVTRGSTQVQRLLTLTRLDEHLNTIESPESPLD
jgi:anti-sigma B factor antagonist